MEPILDIGVVDSVKQGTMIDILIAAGVVGIIVLCGVVIYKSVVPSTRGTRALADIRSTVQAVQMYYVYEGKWPVPEKGSTNLADVPGFNEYFTSLPNDPFGTEVVPNLRYYCNGDANTPATRWLLVSNGPDKTADVINPTFDKADELVGGELGGRNGAIPKGKNKYYGYGKDAWSKATSPDDKGDMGRGGP